MGSALGPGRASPCFEKRQILIDLCTSTGATCRVKLSAKLATLFLLLSVLQSLIISLMLNQLGVSMKELLLSCSL